MTLDYFIKRLWNDPIRNILFCIILFYPLVEIIFYLKDIPLGNAVYYPDYAFFLTCNTAGVGHIFQSLLLWFMPIYCLVLTADDCIEDYHIGLKNVLVSKIGIKKYVQAHLVKSFVYAFLLIFSAMLINLLLVHIIFRGGQFSPYTDEAGFISTLSQFYQWEVKNPLWANIVFSLITAFMSGLISMVGTISAIMIHNKKLVYGITLIFWFIPFLQKNSLMYLFQPHTEYDLDTLVPIGVTVSCIYIAYILFGYFKEVRFGKTTI